MGNKNKLSKRGKEIRECLIANAEMLSENGLINDPRTVAGSFLTLMAGMLALDIKVHEDFAQAGFITDRKTILKLTK